MTTARVVDLDLTGRTAMVTGAGSGIGRACALRLAAAGAEVVVVDIDADAAKRVADQAGGRAVTADLADLDGIRTLPAAVDVLVNNAGLQVVAPLTEFPDDKFSLIQRVMAEAPYRLVKLVLPHMYERGWGRIVNISSVNGQRGAFGQANYAASKAGMHGFTKSLALEFGSRNITVNTVSPGYLQTAMVEKVPREILESRILPQIPAGRLGDPDEVAQLVAYLVSPRGAFVNGADLSINGGQHMG